MNDFLIHSLRSRWLALVVHASLWILLGLSLTHLGGKAPEFHESSFNSLSPQTPAPIAGLDSLFSFAPSRKTAISADALNPFFTRYFVPATPPAGPPPTTRKIEVTYQGFYQTADSPNHAILKLGDAFVAAKIGAAIATNLFVAQATMQTLTLTNLAAQTNVLLLNAKKEIEVPIK